MFSPFDIDDTLHCVYHHMFAFYNMDLSLLSSEEHKLRLTTHYRPCQPETESVVTFLPINTLTDTARIGLLSYHKVILTPDGERPFETPTKSAESVAASMKQV